MELPSTADSLPRPIKEHKRPPIEKSTSQQSDTGLNLLLENDISFAYKMGGITYKVPRLLNIQKSSIFSKRVQAIPNHSSTELQQVSNLELELDGIVLRIPVLQNTLQSTILKRRNLKL